MSVAGIPLLMFGFASSGFWFYFGLHHTRAVWFFSLSSHDLTSSRCLWMMAAPAHYKLKLLPQPISVVREHPRLRNKANVFSIIEYRDVPYAALIKLLHNLAHVFIEVGGNRGRSH